MNKLYGKHRKHLHDKLGYGYPTVLMDGDAFQPNYGCNYCEGKLTQDSQGNWFHLS